MGTVELGSDDTSAGELPDPLAPAALRAPAAFDEATFAARLEQAALADEPAVAPPATETPQYIAFDELAESEPVAVPAPAVAAVAPLEPVALPEPAPIPVPVAIDAPPPFRAAAPATFRAVPAPGVTQSGCAQRTSDDIPLAPAIPAPSARRRRGGLADRMVRAAQAAHAAAQTYAAAQMTPEAGMAPAPAAAQGPRRRRPPSPPPTRCPPRSPPPSPRGPRSRTPCSAA